MLFARTLTVMLLCFQAFNMMCDESNCAKTQTRPRFLEGRA